VIASADSPENRIKTPKSLSRNHERTKERNSKDVRLIRIAKQAFPVLPAEAGIQERQRIPDPGDPVPANPPEADKRREPG
jgi:hypothetical protein